MKPTEPPTRTIFRTYPEGDVIALFIDLNHHTGCANRWKCVFYQHLGQHGEADYPSVVEQTRPSTPEEIEPLKRELENLSPLPYNIQIMKRKPRNIAL